MDQALARYLATWISIRPGGESHKGLLEYGAKPDVPSDTVVSAISVIRPDSCVFRVISNRPAPCDAWASPETAGPSTMADK